MNTHVRDNLNYLDDSRVKYQTGTSDVGPTSGTTILDVITAPAFTPISSSRLLRVMFHYRSITGTVSGDVFEMMVREGSTQLNSNNEKIQSTGTGQNGGVVEALVASPSAAAHTYNGSIQRASGTGTGTVNGSSTFAILITVEDIAAA